MKSFSLIFKKLFVLWAVLFLAVSSVFYVLPLHVYAADFSAVADNLTPEENEYFYENLPELIQGIAGSEFGEEFSPFVMASEYEVVPAKSENPPFYIFPGQTVEFPIVYQISGGTPVAPGPDQYMYFQLYIELPSVSGVRFYVDSAYASYLGQNYYTSYSSSGNYYFIIPPTSGISDSYGGLLAFEFRIKAVYDQLSAVTVTDITGYTVHEESAVRGFSITNNHGSASYQKLDFSGNISVGAVTGTLTQSSFKSFVHYSTSGQITDIQSYPGNSNISIGSHSINMSSVSIENPVYGLIWSVPSFQFILGKEDHLLGGVSKQNGIYVPATAFKVTSKVQWFPNGRANDVLGAIRENTAAVNDAASWVKKNYAETVRTNDILSQTNNLQSESNKLQQTNNQQQLEQTQTIRDQTTTITNQTNEMMNGYDNSSMGSSSDQLSGAFQDYDDAEDQILSSASGSLNSFSFMDYLQFTDGLMSSMSFAGSFITSFMNASGDFFSVVMIGLCMSFISILVGLWRFWRN